LILGWAVCAVVLPGCTAVAPRSSATESVAEGPPAASSAPVAADPPPMTSTRVAMEAPEPPIPPTALAQAQPAEEKPTVHVAPPIPPDRPSKPTPAAQPAEFPRPTEPAPKAADDPALITAVRLLMENRPGEAVTVLMNYDKPTQQLLLCLLPAIVRLSEGKFDQADPKEIALIMMQMDSALSELRRKAPLVIERMCYCRRIDGFGQFDPLPDDRAFRQGELVQIYAELQNYFWEKHGQFYEMRLSSTVEIRDQAGAVVFRQDFRELLERSQSPRHDYYFPRCRFCVPENLPPGDYRLVLKVTEAPSKRTAQQDLPLRVTTRPADH
jgi:hypothetical protein